MVGPTVVLLLLMLLLLIVVMRQRIRADSPGDHPADRAEAAAAEFVACYAADSSAEECGAEATLAAFSTSGTFLTGDVPRVSVGAWAGWRAGVAMVVAAG